tara:strand:- start:299 stop:562 length:264 start_codon:yes stop_codon:yes gene_type:complete
VPTDEEIREEQGPDIAFRLSAAEVLLLMFLATKAKDRYPALEEALRPMACTLKQAMDALEIPPEAWVAALEVMEFEIHKELGRVIVP